MTVKYVQHKDHMWDEHARTVSAECTCDYTAIRSGGWVTIAILRDVDDNCKEHAD